jgi:hypothetical protein
MRRRETSDTRHHYVEQYDVRLGPDRERDCSFPSVSLSDDFEFLDECRSQQIAHHAMVFGEQDSDPFA